MRPSTSSSGAPAKPGSRRATTKSPKEAVAPSRVRLVLEGEEELAAVGEESEEELEEQATLKRTLELICSGLVYGTLGLVLGGLLLVGIGGSVVLALRIRDRLGLAFVRKDGCVSLPNPKTE